MFYVIWWTVESCGDMPHAKACTSIDEAQELHNTIYGCNTDDWYCEPIMNSIDFKKFLDHHGCVVVDDHLVYPA